MNNLISNADKANTLNAFAAAGYDIIECECCHRLEVAVVIFGAEDGMVSCDDDETDEVFYLCKVGCADSF